MLPQTQRQWHHWGRFVCFTKSDSTEVKGALVRDVHDNVDTVHCHTQAASQHHTFTPLYRNTTNNKLEPILTPNPYHEPVIHDDVPMGQVMIVGDMKVLRRKVALEIHSSEIFL